MSDDWVPEARPVPEELTEDFEPTRYEGSRTHWVPLKEKLDQASRDELLAIFGGYPSLPNV